MAQGGFGSNAKHNVGSFSFPYDVQVVTNLNGHGLMGLVTANYGSGSGNTLTVLTNNGTGIFGSNATYIVGRGPYSVTAADIFGNGRALALISANYNSGTLTVLTNNGWGICMSSNTAYNLGADGTECVIAADLNRNGRMDLVSANTTSSSLTVLTNNGNGGILPSAPLCSINASRIRDGGGYLWEWKTGPDLQQFKLEHADGVHQPGQWSLRPQRHAECPRFAPMCHGGGYQWRRAMWI